MKASQFMGTLFTNAVRGSEVFSFEYDSKWIESGEGSQLDPDLQLYTGPQYLKTEKLNFGIFLDSCPDIKGAVSKWKSFAKELVISQSEQEQMGRAFRFVK